jgi:hypothetical protein
MGTEGTSRTCDLFVSGPPLAMATIPRVLNCKRGVSGIDADVTIARLRDRIDRSSIYRHLDPKASTLASRLMI